MVITAEVFSLRALPLSLELLIKTLNLASGSLYLSFPFTTSCALFPFLFQQTHTHSGAKVGISLQFVPPSQALNFSDFLATRTNYCNKTPLLLYWPFLFSQPWPIWSRTSCVRSPKEINHRSPKWWCYDYRAQRARHMKAPRGFLIIIKVYCCTFIHEVSADASLGCPSVRQVQRYQMMHWLATELRGHCCYV